MALLAALGGCRSGVATQQAANPSAPFGRADGVPNGKRFLAEHSRRARAAGAGESEVLAVRAGAPGDRIDSMLSVPENVCALVVARATQTIEDVDLYVYGEDGGVLGSDESPNRNPTLMVCPPHPRRMFVVARVAAGHGLIALGAQRVEPRDANRVGQATGAHGHPGEARGRVEAWPGLTERVAQHRRQIGGGWQDLRKVAVPLEPRVPTRVSSVVEANGCVDALVIPSDDVSHLDVSVLDESGRIVGRAAATGRERSIILCSPVRAPVTFEVRPHSGRGLGAIVLSRSVAGTERDIRGTPARFDVAAIGELEQTRTANAERLSTRGYVAGKVLGQGQLHVGRRSSLGVDLPAGCSRIDVLSGRPVRGVEAWLWSDAGVLLGNARGGAQVPLFACVAGGKARMDIEAITQPGRFAVELRPERNTPKPLTEQPLAASRLLQRMSERGIIQNAEQVGAVRTPRLVTTALYREEILVPFGRCVDLTVSLGPGASGVELRLLEKTSGAELSLARGSFSVSDRVCALEQPRTIHAVAEVRALAGETVGLVASRMLSPNE
jgi:hypothetical protein